MVRKRKTKKEKLEEELAKYPQVSDVVFEVTKLDSLNKGSELYLQQHKRTVAKVKEYNDFYGQGSISISKVRYMKHLSNYYKKQALAKAEASNG